ETLIGARLVQAVERFDASEIVLSSIADREQSARVADHRALERGENFLPDDDPERPPQADRNRDFPHRVVPPIAIEAIEVAVVRIALERVDVDEIRMIGGEA